MERLKGEHSESSAQKFFSPSKEIDQAVDIITDDILSMMCYGDIHESQMFPFWEANLMEILKNKFPFNRPIGIDTSLKGVEGFIDQVIQWVLKHHSDEVLDRLKTWVK